MSWSVSAIGTPEKIIEHLEAQGASMTGQSKEEFEAAKPHLFGLLRENFHTEQPIMIDFSASGSGYKVDGKEVSRNCQVNMKQLYNVKL